MATNVTDEEIYEDVDLNRMPVLSWRLPWHYLEALVRACKVDDRNRSEMYRLILDGRAPNLVERGLLCGVCHTVNCRDAEHKATWRAHVRERELGELARLQAKYGQ